MTLSNPLISVTMITYNHEKYIGEAVESILNQTYTNFELIIVNDGSNDKTDEIIRKFRDERITYIHQENQGTSSAMNRAILDSRGKYIAFMSGDDISYPHRLETEYNYLVTSQKKIVFSWVDFIDENSQIITDSHFAENLFNHPNRTRAEILRHFFFHGNYINAVTGLIYRELLLDAGLFNIAAIQIQDFEMWLKLIKTHEIHILPDQLIKYRIRDIGKNLSSPSNFIRAHFEVQQVYRRMFNNVPKDLFKAAFSDKIRKSNFSDGIEYELEKAFLYLQHNSTLVQIIGCEKLFDLLQDINILSWSISEYNFTLINFYQLTNQIDFLNKKILSIVPNNFLLKEKQLEDANFALIEANYETKQNAELHQLRKQIAEECLNISDEQITDMYLGLLGKTHKMLVNSSIKYESLTDEEQIFVNNIIKIISQGFDQPKAIQHLLAAMLYRRADQLPLQHDLSRIPRWLLKDYLQFLFSSPVHFQEPGDADNYYYYMQGWINYLHTSILKNSDSQLWNEIVNSFASIANFIPLYFNEHNLKDIYVKRGEIIEFLLKLKGYEVDYEFADRPTTRKKIRLGVLAAYFIPGSETFAYLPVYEYISRDFEVILYSLNQTGHQLEQYCQSCANSFKLLPQDLTEQVNIIRADNIDILFIATNVTIVMNQIYVLSMHRLARIQVTSGGSVVTTGIRHIDYYISGTLTDPSATAEQQYQEKLVKLEGTAHCFSYGNEEGKVIVKSERQSLGIADDAIIFISAANYFKIIPELIDTWAKIILGVSKSVLVLLPFGPNWSTVYPKKAFVNHLNKVFSKHGITADRLIVLDPQPVPNRQDVKAYFTIADVYLDSFPFAGTTSLIEPLQVNLPVIARQGTTFRSAMGSAMVQALDVPGLVADSEESYIQLAIALGTDPELRQQKSAQIKEKMQANPSFLDSRSYSAKIGNLFQELFSKYLADTLSQNFRLGNINLIIFPDWSQPEDLLYQDLASAISTLTTHPDKSHITLLIDTQNISDEEADMLLSSLTMNLLMEEDVDITEGPEISLLGKLSDAQWKTLLPRINTRIALTTDNQSAIAQAKAETLSFCNLDSLSL
ncbi:glycosyltransferase [Nostoc sp. FACHB-892]|uniref:glycosyltransferase n=1 Tax=Nostoc sp. FACHB-892 TaxID=2692843 RepID=UPI001681D75D|nr:glycosyltransferase [Nostoc sp. FACHB-892]MBD2725722.1 glycosyltransferase [Nostoc sp. FACHB-892]